MSELDGSIQQQLQAALAKRAQAQSAEARRQAADQQFLKEIEEADRRIVALQSKLNQETIERLEAEYRTLREDHQKLIATFHRMAGMRPIDPEALRGSLRAFEMNLLTRQRLMGGVQGILESDAGIKAEELALADWRRRGQDTANLRHDTAFQNLVSRYRRQVSYGVLAEMFEPPLWAAHTAFAVYVKSQPRGSVARQEAVGIGVMLFGFIIDPEDGYDPDAATRSEDPRRW